MLRSRNEFARLELETLARRDVPAVNVTLDATGVLLIQGTDEADTVIVSEVDGQIVVQDLSEGASAPQEFDIGDVASITFVGDAGADVFINTTELPSVALGGAGADILVGGSADDILLGGPGRDTLIGNRGADIILGEGGDDVLVGGGGQDILVGGGGNDTILRGGNDDVRGGDNKDRHQDDVTSNDSRDRGGSNGSRDRGSSGS